MGVEITRQDDDSMMIVSIEKRGISVMSGRACESCCRGVRASRIVDACVRVLLSGRALVDVSL